ncbi:peptidylprolyl isomerase [Actibacterium mucosum KCTC 23349]|uniref:Parvulin-like PPIase n=1 Tax=Actibacterium mucosum KCTC 23349 TaxID=1454373 RepID=A0A037ZMH0_9RHOB|nr:peptidylprolyl isomerase [Actibacterium mucosum]KAJ57294.1 peptidylprolyl isomerase [Actibacterium mucosum KCTC 23349]
MHFTFKSTLAALAITGFGIAALAQDANTVVATVGGQDITLGQMIVMTTQLPEQYRQLPDDVLFQAVLDQLVRQTAMAQTIDGKLSLEAQLAFENQRMSFLANEALAIAAGGAVTDETVQAEYQKLYVDAPTEEEFNASHILVETEEEAIAIKEELDGGADFAGLAREKSTGPSGPNGGSLGWFGTGMMVKPFEDAVLSLSVGQVSDPVETQFGWHVIILIDKRAKPAPELAQVRGEIENQLRQSAVEAEIERVLAATTVDKPETEIDPALLRDQALVLNK